MHAPSKSVCPNLLLDWFKEPSHELFQGQKPSWEKLRSNPSPWLKAEIKSCIWDNNDYVWTCALVRVQVFFSRSHSPTVTLVRMVIVQS